LNDGEIQSKDIQAILSGKSLLDIFKKFYHENGYLIARGLVKELLPEIHNDIREIIKISRKQAGLKQIDYDENIPFDEGVEELVNHNREIIGNIHDVSRGLISVHKVGTHEGLLALIKEIMGVGILYYTRNSAIVTLTIPSEEQYLFPWHPDFNYGLGSLDGLSVWIPFADVMENKGALAVLPGTHKNGILPSYSLKKENRIHYVPKEEEWIKNIQPVFVKLTAGDCLIFSTLLLHRSVPNDSNRCRWSVQFRYNNPCEETVSKRNWSEPIAYSHVSGKLFKDQYPEYYLGEIKS